jgi:hypothetical protein
VVQLRFTEGVIDVTFEDSTTAAWLKDKLKNVFEFEVNQLDH